jgi:NTE family protein
MEKMRLAVALLSCAVAWPAVAQAPAPAASQTGPAAAPKCALGLVLSGGGARGAAHIGVLEVLEANGIRPDCVAGASMGAIVGSLYAAGFSLDDIDALVNGVTWRSLYAEPMNRGSMPIVHRMEQQRTSLRVGFDGGGVHLPRGILHDGRVNRALIERLAPAGFAAGRDFGRLPIPFRTVGTDLRTGDRVVLTEGDLARAVRASMSVPLAYPAVEWGDYVLVDGGLVDNVPVSLARAMGAEYVIAVDVHTPIDPDVDTDLVGVTNRIVDLLYDTKNRENAVPAELTIVPQLDDHSFSDYSSLEILVERGREAARAVVDQIPAQYRTGRPHRAPSLGAAAFGDRRIGSIEVIGNEYLSNDFLIRESELEVDARFAFGDVLNALDHLYSTSLVQGAWLDVREAEDDSILVELRVTEQYRNTADIGLAYQSDDQAQGFLRVETRDVLGGGDRLQLNTFASGRELRLGFTLRGEQLLGAHFGYQVDLVYHQEKPKFYEDLKFVNRAEFDRAHIRLATDLQLGSDHLGQAGFLLGSVDTRERLGLDFPLGTQKKRLIFGRYVWDTLESLTHPRRGIRVEALAERNEASLGATTSYWRLEGTLRLARSVGPLVLEGRGLYGFSSGDLPISEWFLLGGPELIPGVAREELWGRQAVAASVSANWDLLSIMRLYTRVGAGGVWDEPTDIGWAATVTGFGVGATIATPVGPIQLDYGWAEAGRNRLYIAIGWQ